MDLNLQVVRDSKDVTWRELTLSTLDWDHWKIKVIWDKSTARLELQFHKVTLTTVRTLTSTHAWETVTTILSANRSSGMPILDTTETIFASTQEHLNTTLMSDMVLLYQDFNRLLKTQLSGYLKAWIWIQTTHSRSTSTLDIVVSQLLLHATTALVIAWATSTTLDLFQINSKQINIQ